MLKAEHAINQTAVEGHPAAVPEEEHQPTQDRISLLDIVRANLQRRGKQSILFRVIVCGELATEGRQQDIGPHFQKFFKQFQTENDSVTGLLMVYSKSFLHVIEGTLKILQGFTRELGNNRGSDGNPLMKNVRVLISANDVPKRYFPFWASRNIEMKIMETGAGEYADPSSFSQEKIAELIADCVVASTKLGHFLSSSNKLDMKLAMDDLYHDHKNLFPKQELLMALSNTEGLMTIEEWLETYDGHTDLILDGEKVWPIPRPIA